MNKIALEYIKKTLHNKKHLKDINEKHIKEIIQHLKSLNKNDRNLRFGINVNDHWIEHYINNLDFQKNHFIAYSINSNIIGLCQIARTNKNYIAEIAISVLEEYQNINIGKLLLVESVFFANEIGFDFISIDYLIKNYRIINWIKKTGLPIQRIGVEGKSVFPTISRKDYLNIFEN